MDKNFLVYNMWYVDGLDEIELADRERAKKEANNTTVSPHNDIVNKYASNAAFVSSTSQTANSNISGANNNLMFSYNKQAEKVLIKKYASLVRMAKINSMVLMLIFIAVTLFTFLYLSYYVALPAIITIILSIVYTVQRKKLNKIKGVFKKCSITDLKVLYESNEELKPIAPNSIINGNSHILITLSKLPIVPNSVKSLTMITRQNIPKGSSSLDIVMQNNEHIVISESLANNQDLINAIIAINPKIYISQKMI